MSHHEEGHTGPNLCGWIMHEGEHAGTDICVIWFNWWGTWMSTSVGTMNKGHRDPKQNWHDGIVQPLQLNLCTVRDQTLLFFHTAEAHTSPLPNFILTNCFPPFTMSQLALFFLVHSQSRCYPSKAGHQRDRLLLPPLRLPLRLPSLSTTLLFFTSAKCVRVGHFYPSSSFRNSFFSVFQTFRAKPAIRLFTCGVSLAGQGVASSQVVLLVVVLLVADFQ